jgi:transposase
VTGLLERELLAAGPWRVVRCPPHLMARSRVSARERGKSDPSDALAVARAVLRKPNLPVAFNDPVSWELRLLVDRREDLVGQRVGVMNRPFLAVASNRSGPSTPNELQFAIRREALLVYLREQPGLWAELAREEVADLGRFSENIYVLTGRIVRRVNDLESTLPTLLGCAELTAAKLISEAANVDRFPNESAFARCGGLAPIPEWSGSTTGRVRVCRSGNGQINTAIHRIAVVQLRLDCAGRDYYQRRRAEGDSGATAVRCLKRRVCRVVSHRHVYAVTRYSRI